MKKLIVNKYSLIINLLLICLIVYFSQGPLLLIGSPIGQISLVVIIIVSLFFMLRVITLKSKQPPFVWVWFFLILLNVLGYLFTSNLEESSNFSQIKTILIATLPFYPFYYLTRKSIIQRKHLIVLFLVMLAVSILQFYYNKQTILSMRLSDREDVVNNIGYYFVMLVPYVFLFKKKILSLLSLFIILIFVIQSAKRGALIVALVGTTIFIYHQLFLQKSTHFVRNFALSAIALISISLYLYNYFLNNDYLIARLDQIDEGGSGRSTIYSNLLSSWYRSDDIINFIFGYGFRSSVRYSGTGNLAHNDWLEMLINFGLLGFLTYFLIFVSLIYSIFSKGTKSQNKFVILSITLIWFSTSLFSMFYTTTISVFAIIVLAYLLGDNSSNKCLKQGITTYETFKN